MSSLTVRRWTLRAATLLLFACAHAKTTEAQRQDQVEPAAKSSAVKPEIDSDKPRPASTGEQRKAIPVAARPEGLLKPGAEQKIRNKLSEGGLIEEGKTSTEAVLRRFQASHDLPATGMPDHETIRKLGLNPDDVFRKAPP